MCVLPHHHPTAAVAVSCLAISFCFGGWWVIQECQVVGRTHVFVSPPTALEEFDEMWLAVQHPVDERQSLDGNCLVAMGASHATLVVGAAFKIHGFHRIHPLFADRTYDLLSSKFRWHDGCSLMYAMKELFKL